MDQDDRVDALAGLSLFGDLGRPQLIEVAHTFEEESFPAGQRILRQGFAGTGFYVILEGQVAVRIDGDDRAMLGKGDFFGEMSLLLGEAPVADVVATGPLRVLHLGGPDLRAFLERHPTVMYRMLQAVARRLRNANRWGS
ncbi:MAG: cyclic nucleotide-binding domain-containing protein [Chloroflexi bacterium]|nr:cyclic nucleotide-binding domain-containing protein [Chloroflexota bacterium]HEV8054203.1 cyclic nucleotide-binding domain-containing protein [Candidatus Limnocylindrales bacterium]